MDDLSNLMGSLGQAGVDPAKLGDLAQAVQDEGGLDDLVGKLQGSGLGGTVDTWVGAGQNSGIDPTQLGDALGGDEVQRLASKSGIDVASLLPLLAAFLPQIINMLTPDGKVPDGGLNQAAQSGDLGSLLSGLAGGGASGADLGGLLGGLGGMLGGGDKGQ